MRKIPKFLLTALMTVITCLSASAFTVVVDHPEAVTVKTVDNGTYKTTVLNLNPGANEVTPSVDGQLSVKVNSPWVIDSAVKSSGASMTYFMSQYTDTYTTSSTETYTITTHNPEAVEPEPPTPSTYFTLNIDHPEALNAFVLYDGDSTKTTLSLTEGDNQIETTKGGTLSITKVSPWTIESAEGLQQNPITGGYSLQFSAGHTGTYNIVTKEPEPSSFVLNIDHPEALNAFVLYDGDSAKTTLTLVEGDNKVYTAKGGTLSITKVSPWIIESAEGLQQNPITGGYSLQFSAGHTGIYNIVTKEPEPDPTYFTLNIDHPEAITAQVSYNSQAAQTLSLVAGANQIESTEAGLLLVKANDPWAIETADGLTRNPINGGYSKDFAAGFEGSFSITTKDTTPKGVTLVVDHPEAITVEVGALYGGSKETVDIVEGKNVIVLPSDYSYIQIREVAPYILLNVVNSAGTASNINDGGCRLSFYSASTETYTITTRNLDESRTARFKLTADDASLFTARFSGTNALVELVNGENTVKFDPELEQNLMITANDADNKPIYKVTLNGEEVADNYSSYFVPISQDAEVVVTAVIPSVPVTISFAYGSDDAREAITYVTVDGVKVEDFNGDSLEMTAGQVLGLNGNSSMFSYDNLVVDGTARAWRGNNEFTYVVTKDVTVELEAHKYAQFPITINVTDPSHLKFFRGTWGTDDPILIESTSNTVMMYENNMYVQWQRSVGCKIISLEVNGEPRQLWEYDTYVAVSEGDVLNFVTESVELDKCAVVWFDHKEHTDYFSFMSASRDDVGAEMENGYNFLYFCEEFNPFSFDYYLDYGMDKVNKVYRNGELVSPKYEGYNNYTLTFEDGDVLKVFMSEEPVECNVTFEIDDEVADLLVIHDLIIFDDDMDLIKEGYTCFKGTEFCVAQDMTPIHVDVNGKRIVPVEGTNDCEFVVSEPNTVVKVTKDNGAGVGLVDGSVYGDTAVFNLQGIKVADTTENLPSGIYIVAGKKVVVK